MSADPERIRQLLSILTDNALRYAPVGSAVLLSLVSQGRSCVLSVADQGPGVPDAEKKKIFDRFYRGSQSRTDPATSAWACPWPGSWPPSTAGKSPSATPPEAAQPSP